MLIIVIVITAAGMGLWTTKRVARMPQKLWSKGLKRSMGNKDMPTYICLLDDEIEAVFKGVAKNRKTIITV